ADLALHVPAPAVGGVGWGDAAGLVEARAYALEGQPAGHRLRHVGSRPAAVADLALRVVAPAIRLSRRYAAGVIQPGAQLVEGVGAVHANRRERGMERAIAELSHRVVAPAVGDVSRGERAGVRPARNDPMEHGSARDDLERNVGLLEARRLGP